MSISKQALLLLLTLAIANALAAQPQRVVSLNLCSDQLLLMLADPHQVASVSHLAIEENSSFVAKQAAAYPLNHAQLEEIVTYQPDLVLASRYTDSRLLNTLKQLGYEVYQLNQGNSPEEIAQEIRNLAERLGQTQRGESLIGDMQRRLMPQSATTEERPSAIFYQPRGYTSGSGSLQNEALKLAGWRNSAAENGVMGYTTVSLEQVILWRPDTLFTSTYGASGNSLAERQLNHPALKRLMGNQPILEIPYKYWICPGPMLAEAVNLLRNARLSKQ
ncbi:MAG: ABC transporter substrate-binding protein [Candidatus Thiodiazotropha sp.]|jgi:iron complex transport system substrate-binding protein